MTPPDPETLSRSKVLCALMREATLTAWTGTPGERITVVPQTEGGPFAACLIATDTNTSECEVFVGWLPEGAKVPKIWRMKMGVAAMRVIGAVAEDMEAKAEEEETA